MAFILQAASPGLPPQSPQATTWRGNRLHPHYHTALLLAEARSIQSSTLLSTHRGPNVRPFRSVISHFRILGKLRDKCTEWIFYRWSWHAAKVPHEHLTYTPLGPKFPSVLRFFFFWVEKSKVSRVYSTYTPRADFASILLYDKLLSSCGPILSNMHQLNRTWP